ncbi:MAG: nucleotide exchange factor GrpE [Gammaproteobacteria bacterium]|jgi:molecular chaperone GrpE|nr:nucleotide exchange factor GrpE [Gammaproteobacteria bacterium]
MDTATKDALTAQFRAYLDVAETAADTATEPAADQVPESAPDLFSLLTELAALKNEVKLESRQVKTALEEFRGLFDTLREAQTRLGDEQARGCEEARAAERRALLLALLELRDRMQAGHAQAERFRPGWLGRRRRAPQVIAALAEGMAMSLRRLDEILARSGAQPLAAVGRHFDPQRMHAAELTRDAARPTGEVVAELRPGWLLHGELLRAAEVVVNRPDAPRAPEPIPDQAPDQASDRPSAKPKHQTTESDQ